MPEYGSYCLLRSTGHLSLLGSILEDSCARILLNSGAFNSLVLRGYNRGGYITTSSSASTQHITSSLENDYKQFNLSSLKTLQIQTRWAANYHCPMPNFDTVNPNRCAVYMYKRAITMRYHRCLIAKQKQENREKGIHNKPVHGLFSSPPTIKSTQIFERCYLYRWSRGVVKSSSLVITSSS